jgi:hypothetical protein
MKIPVLVTSSIESSGKMVLLVYLDHYLLKGLIVHNKIIDFMTRESSHTSYTYRKP